MLIHISVIWRDMFVKQVHTSFRDINTQNQRNNSLGLMNIHNCVLLICIDSLNVCSIVYTFKFSNRDTD